MSSDATEYTRIVDGVLEVAISTSDRGTSLDFAGVQAGTAALRDPAHRHRRGTARREGQQLLRRRRRSRVRRGVAAQPVPARACEPVCTSSCACWRPARTRDRGGARLGGGRGHEPGVRRGHRRRQPRDEATARLPGHRLHHRRRDVVDAAADRRCRAGEGDSSHRPRPHRRGGTRPRHPRPPRPGRLRARRGRRTRPHPRRRSALGATRASSACWIRLRAPVSPTNSTSNAPPSPSRATARQGPRASTPSSKSAPRSSSAPPSVSGTRRLATPEPLTSGAAASAPGDEAVHRVGEASLSSPAAVCAAPGRTTASACGARSRNACSPSSLTTSDIRPRSTSVGMLQPARRVLEILDASLRLAEAAGVEHGRVPVPVPAAVVALTKVAPQAFRAARAGAVRQVLGDRVGRLVERREPVAVATHEVENPCHTGSFGSGHDVDEDQRADQVGTGDRRRLQPGQTAHAARRPPSPGRRAPR